MNSYILIDGVMLYIVMGIFVCLVLAIILFGCSYVNEARERDKMETKYKKLRHGYNKLIGMYQRETCTLPVIDEYTSGVPQFINNDV